MSNGDKEAKKKSDGDKKNSCSLALFVSRLFVRWLVRSLVGSFVRSLIINLTSGGRESHRREKRAKHDDH